MLLLNVGTLVEIMSVFKHAVCVVPNKGTLLFCQYHHNSIIAPQGIESGTEEEEVVGVALTLVAATCLGTAFEAVRSFAKSSFPKRRMDPQ